MRLALVFNPFSYKIHEENLRVVQKYFGLFPPLSLAWVAGIAERAGHTVCLVDARTLGLSREQTLEILREFRPDMLGFMMTTYMYRETLGWAEFLKKQLNVPVIIGGYNLRVYPAQSVTPEPVDFGVHQQAVRTLPEFLEAFEQGGGYAEVEGLIYKRDGRVIVNEDRRVPDFNEFPFPARHLLPNELYAEFPTERKNFTVMVTSLGCPKQCNFCEAGGTPYAPRRPELVLAEIEECVTRHGIREIDIFDYEFPIVNKRAREICEGLIARNLDVTWACRARIDSVDRDMLELMHRAGCRRIYYGIESGNQQILDTLNKGITLDQIRATVRATHDAGIQALGFFLIGSPGETRATVDQTLRFARELDLEYVQFSKLTAKPLSKYWRDLVDSTGYDYWAEYILGRTHEQALPRPWVDLTNEQIDELSLYAYKKHHGDLRFLLKHSLRVRSWPEFKRKFNAFIDMFFRQEAVAEHWIQRGEQFSIFNENPRALLNRMSTRAADLAASNEKSGE
jgi:anaerobic magnesium-protoporphyrin IX monomethyl ester cyclase